MDTRPAWAETEVIPGHELRAPLCNSTAKRPSDGGICGRRPGGEYEQIVPCWKCRYCLRGQYWMCCKTTCTASSVAHPGAMGDHLIYSADALVHKVPRDLPPHHAAFAEPLACSLHVVERAGITFDDTVVVAGCGPIGPGMVAGACAKSPAM